jgi:hypothetical protein
VSQLHNDRVDLAVSRRIVLRDRMTLTRLTFKNRAAPAGREGGPLIQINVGYALNLLLGDRRLTDLVSAAGALLCGSVSLGPGEDLRH